MKVHLPTAILAGFLGGVAVPALAQSSHWAEPNEPVASMMIDSERKWAQASCDHNRIAEAILADDFMGTAPDGSRYERAREMEIDMSRTDKNCTLDGAKVRFFGADLAMVYGSERATATGKDGHDSLRCLVWSDTWLKRNGKWQIISAQDTAVACK